MGAPMLPLPNFYGRPSRISPSFQLASAILLGCRSSRYWMGCPSRERRFIVRTSTEQSRFTWTDKTSRLRRRLSNRHIDFAGLVVVGGGSVRDGRLFEFGQDAPGRLRILFTDHKHYSTKARERVLRRCGRGQITFDAGRFQQSLNHHRFRFLFRVEHFDEFFVWFGLRRSEPRLTLF